jgi:hypothetical protein
VTHIIELFWPLRKIPTLEKQAPRTKRAEPGTTCHDQDRYAVAVSAIAASCFVAFPSLSPQVGASAPIAGAKGDRADIRPLGTECGEKAWPYFDAACTRDARIPLAQPRDLRMIAADRAGNSVR